MECSWLVLGRGLREEGKTEKGNDAKERGSPAGYETSEAAAACAFAAPSGATSLTCCSLPARSRLQMDLVGYAGTGRMTQSKSSLLSVPLSALCLPGSGYALPAWGSLCAPGRKGTPAPY